MLQLKKTKTNISLFNLVSSIIFGYVLLKYFVSEMIKSIWFTQVLTC